MRATRSRRTKGMTMASEAEQGLTFHPMEQFKVRPLFDNALSVTSISNVTLWMGVAVACVIVLFVLGTSKKAVVPGRTQSVAEVAYSFIYKMVVDVAGQDGVRYFPYIFTLFTFILA